MTRVVLSTTLPIFALMSLAFAGDEKEELKMLDGTWQATSAELAGKKLPDEFKLELRDGKYTVGIDKGTVSVDPTKKRKSMDINGVEGPNKGKTFLCIYELDGDTLRICYDLSSKTRPTKFETKPDTKLFLVTYKREKR